VEILRKNHTWCDAPDSKRRFIASRSGEERELPLDISGWNPFLIKIFPTSLKLSLSAGFLLGLQACRIW
jgi:hypothetical protein